MPTPKSETTKKHGDKLEPLIDRTASGSEPGERREDDDDPTALQDDDDEDVENDADESRRDVGE